MMRKPVFWIVFAITALACTLFSFKFFPHAFPIVNLDLEMNRQMAFEKANTLASQFDLGPEKYQQAATFHLDGLLQHFVELEQGGGEAFRKLLDSHLYEPYTWKVRHFQEDKTQETLFRFTPEGKPYGFVETLAEDEQGASLDPEAALQIAVETATTKWNVNLDKFKLIEESKETLPGGRTDHTFTYERKNETLGEGKYRVKLVVAGNKLTELTHFVHIPESFTRKYQEMRSTNDTIAQSALIAVILIYVIGGCIVGLFLLIKDNWVLWKRPLIWGLIIGALMALAQANSLPLAWMDYDTALAKSSFIMQQIIQWIGIFIGETLLITISIMAAESLTRKAFPNHIQLWRMHEKDLSITPEVTGRTMAGYLFIPLFFAFDVTLYFLSTNVLGWWVPSSSMFEPDILATYLPWFSSIAISMHAGIFEECLFRAVPIAGAVLLGRKFGKTPIWLVVAFILQALIFGAGHANYPMQPAYARVVELFIPAVSWGLIYYFFGLLPVIILHVVFDVVWFAMPLFVSTAEGSWISQIFVILISFIPIWLILWNRIKIKKWQQLPTDALNRAWNPPAIEMKTTTSESAPEIPEKTFKWHTPAWIIGIVGFILWISFANFNNDATDLKMTRSLAIEQSEQLIGHMGFEMADKWTVMAATNQPLNNQDKFLWQTSGDSIYHALLGQFLPPPRWHVRYAQFEGDVVERAEEWSVYLAGDHYAPRVVHTLPEASADTSFTEEQARSLAHSYIESTYFMEPLDLKEISAEASKKPNRMDWTFTLADTAGTPLDSGEARITVHIAGQNVVDSYRSIHIPEEWERDQRNQNTIAQIINIVTNLLVVGLFIFGIVRGIIYWTKKSFSVPAFLVFSIGLFVIQFSSVLNGWQAAQINFLTAQPFQNQNIIALAFTVIFVLFYSAGLGIMSGLLQTAKETGGSYGLKDRFSSLSLGLILTGVIAFIQSLQPAMAPAWAEYSAMSAKLPLFETITSPVSDLITQTLLLLFIVTMLNHWTATGTQKKWIILPFFLLIGLVLSGSAASAGILSWLITGVIRGAVMYLLYTFVLRTRLAWIPMLIAGTHILNTLQEGLMQAHPGALTGAIIGSVLILIIAEFWSRSLKSN